MAHEIPLDELETWAEKLRAAFDRTGPGGTAGAAQAVVTSDDGLSHYRAQELWQEIAYLGYHLHWDLNTLLDMEHKDRRFMVRQVAELNEKAWEEVRTRGA
ncbi:MAG: hypothetical protein AAF567_03690 [Actinomycetota bacterium]